MADARTRKRMRPIIRVFVSSTFSDLKLERDVLQQQVFPKLEQLCLQDGFQFQAIDLRWGVPTEAGLHHRTMRICFEELRRSQEVSPEPNFLILLGNRYGWRPLPEEISAEEFHRLEDAAGQIDVVDQQQPVDVLRQWYLLDENALTPVYILQPRRKPGDGDPGCTDYTTLEAWRPVEQTLWQIVNRAFPADGLRNRFQLLPTNTESPPSIVSFQASATEQEIWAGALSVPNAEQHVRAFFRNITNRDEFSLIEVKDFFDVTEAGQFDGEAKTAQEELKEAISWRLGDKAVIPMPFSRLKPCEGKVMMDASESEIQSFCDDVERALKEVIERQIREYWEPKASDAAHSESLSDRRTARKLEIEQNEHCRFGDERAPKDMFVGRQDLLERIRAYLENDSRWPLVVHGESGSGKTALLARAFQEILAAKKPIVRFIGVTPRSSDLEPLLRGMCLELRQRNPIGKPLSSNVHEVIQEFAEHLKAASVDRPIIVLLDALDQLSDEDNARRLDWLPKGPLPSYVKIIVSCLSGRDATGSDAQPYEVLQIRETPAEQMLQVGELSTEEARSLVFDRWLPAAGRTIKSENQASVVETCINSCRQPFYLRLLFQEAKLWRSYDTPASPGSNAEDVLNQLWDRLRRSENHGESLVRFALGYFGAARRGLSETEILEVLFADPDYKKVLDKASEDNNHTLPSDPARIPMAIWSRLHYDLVPYLAERSAPGANVLAFYHGQVEQWVKRQFVDKADWNPHLRLGRYFSGEADPRHDHTFSGRTRAFLELPFHLDAAGEDPWAMARLRELPDVGFIQKKVEKTHDTRGTADDFRYFLKARLRAQDHAVVWQLATSRAGLAMLTDFVSGAHLGKLAPFMSADSHLWQEILNAIASLGTADERVDRLRVFVQPNLEARMYESLRGQFRRDASEAREDLQREFLRALAASQEGAIDYIFSFCTHLDLREELAAELATRLQPLCRGVNITAEEAAEGLADWAASSAETLATTADAFGRLEERALAIHGLTALEKRAACLSPSDSRLQCSAAISHGFARHESMQPAERLAEQCFTLLPARPADQWDLGWSAFSESAWRLAIAAAPFPELWARAMPIAVQMLESLQKASDKACTLAGFLRATPWIASPADRVAWLRRLLPRLVRLVTEGAADKDYDLRFLAAIGGDPAEVQLAKPIQQALLDVLADIDRVMPSKADFDLLSEIVLTAAQVDASIENDPKAILAFFKKALPALMKSKDPLVIGFAIRFFIDATAEAKLLSNSTAEIFESAIHEVIARNESAWCQPLVDAVFTHADREWLPRSKNMPFVLTAALLRGIADKGGAAGQVDSLSGSDDDHTRRHQLLTAFRLRLQAWTQKTDPKYHDAITVLWAAALLALGHRDEGSRLLNSVRSAEGDGLPGWPIISMADVLIRAGQGEQADTLLRGLLPSAPILDDPDRLDESLCVAGRLVSAAGETAPAAREFFLDAVSAYRRDVDRLSPDLSVLLLNRCFNLNDRQLAIGFVQLAEREMIQEPVVDSTMAGFWYAAITLACAGDVSAANEVRGQLDDWPKISTTAAVRRKVLRILVGTPSANSTALLGELTQFLAGIEDDETCCEGLATTAVLLTDGPSTLFDQTIAMILDGLDRMADSPWRWATVFESLCQRLDGADASVVFRVMTSVFDFLNNRSESELRELRGYARTFLELAFGLAQKQTDNARCTALLRRLVVTTANVGEKSLWFSQIVSFAFDRLSADQAIAVLDDCRARADNSHSVMEAALRSCPAASLDAVATRVQAGAKGDTGAELLHWCRAYRCLLQRGGATACVSDLENRIRRKDPPAKELDQVDWLTALADTNLQALAAPISDDLFEHLEQFTVDYHTFQSLGKYLEAAAPTWPVADVRPRFDRVLEWASTMPLVNNEDARPSAFQKILSATVAVPTAERDRIQIAILDRAAAVLGTKGLPVLPLRGVGSGALDRAITLLASGNTASRYNSVLCIALRACSEDVDDPTIALLCAWLDQYIGEPISVPRSSLASAVEQCRSFSLKERLTGLLRRTFESTGYNELTFDELLFLTDHPVAWWIGQSAAITSALDDKALRNWVVGAFTRNPSLGPIAASLTSYWLSTQGIDRLDGFWFRTPNKTLH